MISISNLSFIVAGIACAFFGALFCYRKRARIFYGVNVEGKRAVAAGIGMIVLGIAVVVFGIFILPKLIDLPGILNDLPEFRQ